MVCVGLAEEIAVPSSSSIFSLISRVFSSPGKRTPTPWVRPPDDDPYQRREMELEQEKFERSLKIKPSKLV